VSTYRTNHNMSLSQHSDLTMLRGSGATFWYRSQASRTRLLHGIQIPQVGEDGAVPRNGIEVRGQLQRRRQRRSRNQAGQRAGTEHALRARNWTELHHDVWRREEENL
jgi:hypothetical protein